jgi:EAL domain-containing protein (putative c-di-GMP-specific phosphodiesterase class I)
MGLKLSVDDFGTGYSSFKLSQAFFQLTSSRLINRFVRDLATDMDDAVIVSTIISMAHSLKLKSNCRRGGNLRAINFPETAGMR